MVFTIQVRMLGRSKKSKETEGLESVAGHPLKEREKLNITAYRVLLFNASLASPKYLYAINRKVVGRLKSRTL